jgi:LemA protein
MKKLFIVLGVIGFIAFMAISKYNNFVQLEVKTEAAWANVETQYQRRFDLIPSLVSTVKGAANFEQDTLTAVTDARSKIGNTTVDINDVESLAAYQAAQGEMTGALSRLLAVSEAYPEIKAVAAFQDLQVQLEGTENRITVARTDFNGAVGAYNIAVRYFPGSLFAALFGFDQKPMFEADQGAEARVEIDFSDI